MRTILKRRLELAVKGAMIAESEEEFRFFIERIRELKRVLGEI